MQGILRGIARAMPLFCLGGVGMIRRGRLLAPPGARDGVYRNAAAMLDIPAGHAIESQPTSAARPCHSPE
jgi:hypothetical protein